MSQTLFHTDATTVFWITIALVIAWSLVSIAHSLRRIAHFAHLRHLELPARPRHAREGF